MIGSHIRQSESYGDRMEWAPFGVRDPALFERES
jgi:hypothetical protein